MKSILCGATIALSVLLLAGTASAQQVTTGYVGAAYTDVQFSGGSANIYAARAVGSFNLAKNTELQLDGDLASVDTGTTGLGSTTVWGPTAHLFLDNGGAKGGAFVTYEDFNGAHLTGYGLEGRFAASDNVSLGLVGGLGTISVKAAKGSVDVTTLRGEGSYFANDNLRFDASIASLKFNPPGSGPSTTFTTYGLGGEWQMMKSPVSFTASWEHGTVSSSSSNAYSIGIRRTFGGSLKMRDRTSSPFNGGSTNYGGAEGTLFGALLGSVIQHGTCAIDIECPQG